MWYVKIWFGSMTAILHYKTESEARNAKTNIDKTGKCDGFNVWKTTIYKGN